MARRKNRSRGRGRSSRGYSGGGYRGRGERGRGGGGRLFGIGIPFWIGAAVGLTNLDERIPAELKLAAACAPFKLGAIKGVAQGMVLGDLAQKRFGINLSGIGGGKNGVTLGW